MAVILRDWVTILAGVSTSGAYNSPDELDWSIPTVVDTVEAEVQPLGASEDNSNQQRTETLARVILRGYVEIEAVNRIRHHGLDYEVVRAEVPWRGLGRLSHREVIIRRITGG